MGCSGTEGVIYRLLADFIVLIHFLWILFLAFGFIFALRRSRMAYLHGAGLLFSLCLNLLGWYCPLTHLENFLYSIRDPGIIYDGSFLANYLEPLVYPDLPEKLVRAGEIIFVCLNGIAYGWLARRHKLLVHLRRWHSR